MSSLPELTSALTGIMSGIVSSLARWLSDIFRGQARWVATHFVFILVMGGFIGFMGTALADAMNHQEWSNILSGVLGATGAFGFEMMVKHESGSERS